MTIFLDGLWDAVKDTLIIIPILYLSYLLVSYFSHNDNEKYSKILHHTNKAGPVIGAFLGCVPQCGFSSVMSQLYSKKVITLGTLIAVFIATSDEAIPLMISQPKFIPKLLILIAIKVVYAIIVGYLIDGIFSLFSKRKKVLKEKTIINNKTEDKELSCDNIELINNDCACTHGHKHSHKHHGNEEKDGHEHTHSHCCATNIFLDALHHTSIIVAYVFVATLIINLIQGYCGGLEPLQVLFTKNIYIQILVASLIGIIPNCAASVFLVEMFMEGVIMFPALVAGLTAGAGIGIIVLFTSNYKKTWQNILIIILQYVLALIIGIITNFIPIW